MQLPFSVDQFLGVFARYNLAIWPMQVIAYFIAVAVLFLAIKKTKYSDILLIPLLWSIIGFVAAIVLGIREDLGLLVAGLIGTIMIWLRREKITRPVIVHSSITTF